MGKSIHEIHMEFVEKLKARGEKVLQSKKDPMDKISGYDKTENPPKNAGAIYQDSKGTFGLFGDFGATHIEGIKWEDLGLCDARCWYEWIDDRRETKSIDNDKVKEIISKVDEIIKELDNLKTDFVRLRKSLTGEKYSY